MKNVSLYFSISLLSLVFIFSACSTSRQAAEEGPADPGDSEETLATEEERALQELLDESRVSLADLEELVELEVPSVFAQEAAANSPTSENPSQGYRIQLISTRDVQEADTLSNRFEEWIESEDLGYNAQSYVFFKQPYYRVHVGDFQSKTQAADFTKLIKQEFPDAWVVPDRIIPSSTPSDDVTFSTDDDSSDSES